MWKMLLLYTQEAHLVNKINFVLHQSHHYIAALLLHLGFPAWQSLKASTVGGGEGQHCCAGTYAIIQTSVVSYSLSGG
jgi:hypothetical protein